MDYTALKSAWSSAAQPPAGIIGAALSASDTTAQKLAKVNAWQVAGPKIDVPVSSVVGYLALNGKLSGLEAFAANPPSGDGNAQALLAAKEFMTLIAAPSVTIFRMSDSATYAAVAGFLDALAADANTGIAASDVTSLLALAQAANVNWCLANAYPYDAARNVGNLSAPDAANAGVS